MRWIGGVNPDDTQSMFVLRILEKIKLNETEFSQVTVTVL